MFIEFPSSTSDHNITVGCLHIAAIAPDKGKSDCTIIELSNGKLCYVKGNYNQIRQAIKEICK